MRTLDILALILVVVGGLNWGLVGLFEYNLVDSLFGEESALSRIIYVLVGLAAIWAVGRLVPRASQHDRDAATHTEPRTP